MKELEDLRGKQFRYKSKHGLSKWVGTIKEAHFLRQLRSYRLFWIKSTTGIVYKDSEIEIL